MDEKELLTLIENDESETVEFKKSTAELEKALKAICAFLNHKGGTVFFGIEKKKIVGQEVSDQTLKSISQKIRQRIKPEVSPEINVLEATGKKILRVRVKEGNKKPYYLDGIAYRRVGSENVVIPPGEIERIILEKSKRHWDSEICENATLDDIGAEKVQWFLKQAEFRRGLAISERSPVDDALTQINLVKDGKLTNAAILLFGKKTETFFGQSEIRCVLLPGPEFVKPYTTYQPYSGNLFELVEKATAFILSNIHSPLWVEGSETAAKNPYEIPREAVREVVVNAVAHRDYELHSNVQIRVFPDRVEVWNPGRLPPELKLDDLTKPHPSMPANPLVFRQFYRVAFVEDVGGGTTDVIANCRKAGLAEPVFEQKMGNFVVTLWRSALTEEYLEKMDLNDRQKNAVRHIRKQGRMTRAEYERLYEVSGRTANRELEDLASKKFIEKKGKGPGTRYVLARFGEIWRDKNRGS